MTPQVQTAGRGRRQLVMIIALFLVPPIAAWMAWQYLGEHGVGMTTNNGTLISPARPLQLNDAFYAADQAIAGSELAGRWVYLMFSQEGCDAACQQQLFVTRQTRIAVNKDMPRVRRLLVLNERSDVGLPQDLAEQHSDLLLASGASEQVLATLQEAGFEARGGRFFLIDPLGNLMMAYQADAEPRGVLRDLQKLLKVSQVG